MSSTTRFALIPLVSLVLFTGCSRDQGPDRVLIFNKTNGFVHDSIPVASEALENAIVSAGMSVTVTGDSLMFNDDSLATYDVVVFLLTTLDVLGDAEQVSFQRFIQAGGGYVGVHSASDTEYDWPWYGQLVGGYFASHPAPTETTLLVIDSTHTSTAHLPREWTRFDEWYDIRFTSDGITPLILIDETSYKTEEQNPVRESRPIAWYHQFDGGRSFYTALGHTAESYSEPEFIEHVIGGIRYAAGAAGRLDYAESSVRPADSEFTKEVLDSNLNEPMELDFIDENRIIFVGRRGNVSIHDLRSGETTTAANMHVYSGGEEGLMGVAVDPNFDETNWIYLVHSDTLDSLVHLSRFVLEGDTLDLSSQATLLSIPVDRGDACCHSGGSIEFDKDGNLFWTVGDNTNPFASAGTAPIDEQPGRHAWDAQRSAANTNDLRGKILRITPAADGGYTIPDGNLFPATDSTRAEIYVMGNRNPFRISIDDRTGYLYWGEVGPDAGEEIEGRGPRGHDEINQARSAGYYGWPYFIGDNKRYNDFDFATGQMGELFDPQTPANDSPNNTGLRSLPEARPAFIWYPYGESSEFPLTGVGGRTAMAGPVYHADDFRDAPNRFPEYYDGKLFIYEWMRNWVMVVSMTDAGDYEMMETFMPTNLDVSRPMDMMFGPDGSLYLLEYGSNWNKPNEDARLSRILFSGSAS